MGSKKAKVDRKHSEFIADNFFKVGDVMEYNGLRYVATDLLPDTLQVVFECTGFNKEMAEHGTKMAAPDVS